MPKKAEDIIYRTLDHLSDAVIIFLIIICLIIGGYMFYDQQHIRQRAQAQNRLTLDDVPNAAAWISIDNTDISYPVMQGKKADEYLNKDPFGNFLLSGSIFLDWQSSPDFSDPYSVIYGHHMAGGYMFGALDEYLKKGYLETHQTGTLTVRNRKSGKKTKYHVRLFACLQGNAGNRTLFDCADARSTDSLRAYIENHAIFKTGYEKNLNIIALSTCTDMQSDTRTLVFGTLRKY